MIKLNLLPSAEKELFKIDQIQRWVVFYGSVFFCSLLVFIILLAAIWFSLSIQIKSIGANLDIAKQNAPGQDLKTQQNLIKKLNAKIEKASQFEKNHKRYSTILLALAEVMPEGIKIERITIDEKNKMTISGYAQKREDMLTLKNSLEKSAFFTDINSPIANLIKQAAISFSLTMTIKTDILIK